MKRESLSEILSIDGKIKKSNFFKTENEKIKMNWFLYEIASSIFSIYSENRIKKALTKFRISKERFAQFSIFYSKQMTKTIFETLNGKTPNVVLSYAPIESFFKNIDDKLVNDILTEIGKKWDEQLSMCEVCPTRCVSEKEKKCEMFDDDYYP